MNEEQFKTILDTALAGLAQKINERFDEQDLRFDTFASSVGKRFDSLEDRLALLEAKLDTKANAETMYRKLADISQQIRTLQINLTTTKKRHE
jgi:hypothetical protein